MPTSHIKPEDIVQKTWIPEGTKEYKHFKLVTLENTFLGKFLHKKFNLKSNELLLDVGGREGDIAIQLQKPECIHIVDPDPTLKLPFQPGKFWNEKVQNLNLLEYRYKLIICSHILGYLGNQNVQDTVFKNLLSLLNADSSLVLFYNINSGYMSDLLAYSKQCLDHGHYDYFDENLLANIPEKEFVIEKTDISFNLRYSSFEELARCCWFLFGALDQDIEGVAQKFLPKLKADLETPSFSINERVIIITKKQ